VGCALPCGPDRNPPDEIGRGGRSGLRAQRPAIDGGRATANMGVARPSPIRRFASPWSKPDCAPGRRPNPETPDESARNVRRSIYSQNGKGRPAITPIAPYSRQRATPWHRGRHHVDQSRHRYHARRNLALHKLQLPFRQPFVEPLGTPESRERQHTTANSAGNPPPSPGSPASRIA